LDEILGQDKIPAITDQEWLPYIEVVIKEVMRWKLALPFGIPQHVDKNNDYGGYHIPSNSIIIPNIW